MLPDLKVRVKGTEIKFENNQGDVLTLDMWAEPGYPSCAWDVVKDWTIGMRV